MKHTKQFLLTTIFALLLSACGTSPPVRYFNLKPMHAAVTDDAADKVIVGLGPLDIPGYLSRPQIVTRGPNGEVLIDDYRRWAEAVDESIHRIVAANVEGLVDGVTVLSYPYNTMLQLEYRVFGDVVRFDADQDGRAMLIVQWGIISADRDIIVEPRRARYEATASTPGDAGAIVAALNDVIADFSRDIAAQLDGLRRSTGD